MQTGLEKNYLSLQGLYSCPQLHMVYTHTFVCIHVCTSTQADTLIKRTWHGKKVDLDFEIQDAQWCPGKRKPLVQCDTDSTE